MALPNESDPWAEWRAANTWRDRLHQRAAHKALDIPEDMTVNANQSSGLGWRELLAIGATLAGLGWIGKDIIRPPATPPAAAPVIVAPPEPPRVSITTEATKPRSYELDVSTGKLPGQ